MTAQPMPPLGPPDSPALSGAQLSDLMHRLEVKAVIPDKPIDLPASALYYAKRGFPIFPLVPRGKAPLTPHGFLDATTDLKQVEQWWRRHPDANIGLRTGPREDGGCGYDVIDVDGETGVASMASVPSDQIPPPVALSFTPGDPPRGRGPGRHHFVEATGDGNSTKFMDGVDYRGRSGYVCVPPSVGPSGDCYAWIAGARLPGL